MTFLRLQHWWVFKFFLEKQFIKNKLEAQTPFQKKVFEINKKNQENCFSINIGSKSFRHCFSNWKKAGCVGITFTYSLRYILLSLYWELKGLFSHNNCERGKSLSLKSFGWWRLLSIGKSLQRLELCWILFMVLPLA